VDEALAVLGAHFRRRAVVPVWLTAASGAIRTSPGWSAWPAGKAPRPGRRRRPVAWLQSWPEGADPRPFAFRAEHIPKLRLGHANFALEDLPPELV
jgi:hypothetical protein